MIPYDSRGHRVIDPNADDPRYTIGFFLMRVNRPKYWNFFCSFCGEKICEISGEVLYASDISNESTALDKGSVRVRCNSRNCGGRRWFELQF